MNLLNFRMRFSLPLVLLALVGCEANDGVVTPAPTAGGAINVVVNDTKAGVTKENLTEDGFFLFIDQEGSEKDYFVKMKYNATTSAWDALNTETDEPQDMVWIDAHSSDVKVVALYTQDEATKESITTASAYSTTLDQSALENLLKSDMLYASNSYFGSSADIDPSVVINQSSSNIEVTFKHFMASFKVEVEPSENSGEIQSVTLEGLKSSFDWNAAYNSDYAVAGEVASYKMYKDGDTYYAVVPAQTSSEFYVNITTLVDSETLECRTQGYSNTIKSGKEYSISIPLKEFFPSGDVVGSLDITAPEWGESEYQFADVSAEAAAVEEIELYSYYQLNDYALKSLGEYNGEPANNYAGTKFILMTDIDLSKFPNFCGFGSTYAPFKGSFDGNGHTIKNLTRTSYDYNLALFNVVGYGAEIYDLTISNFTLGNEFSVKERRYGALAGYNSGIITNCKAVDGTITAATEIGGLVGYNTGFVKSCSVSNVTLNLLDPDGVKGDIIGFDNNK